MVDLSRTWNAWIDLLLSALITDHMKRHPHNGFQRGNFLGAQIFIRKDERYISGNRPIINGHPGGVGPYGPYKDDTSPQWDNIVRAYEDCRE